MEQSRKQEAYEYIKSKIVFCELKPGDVLDEKKIIRELGFSRTPVREAINALVEENLVHVMPRRGIIVSQIFLKDVEDMLKTRMLIEPYIIEQSIEQLERDDLLKMKDSLQERIEKKDTKMNSLREDFDYQFHMYFAEKAGNQYLYKTMDLLMTHSQRIRYFSTIAQERYLKSYQEHIQIIDGILERDQKAIEQAVQTHFENTKEGYIEIGKMRGDFLAF